MEQNSLMTNGMDIGSDIRGDQAKLHGGSEKTVARSRKSFWISRRTRSAIEVNDGDDEEGIEQSLAFWREQLSNLPVLDLPPNRMASPASGTTECRLQFPPATVLELKRFAEEHSTPIANILLASVKALLFRYTHQEDLVVGFLIAPGSLNMTNDSADHVGLIRTAIGSKLTFEEFITRVNAGAVTANNRKVPVEKVIALLTDRNDGASTLQVGFRCHCAEDCRDQPVCSQSRGLFDLLFDFAETVDGLNCTIHFKTAAFEADTVSRLAEHLTTFAVSAVRNLTAAISSLPVLPDEERHRLINEWNETAAAYPNVCIHTLVEQQAVATPERVAIEFEGVAITYRELDERANQLTHHLKSFGVERETLVGLCLSRSPQMIVAMLAILKSGGAYVPLDPAFPADRLAFMVEDSGMRVIVTETSLEPLIKAKGVRTVCLNQDVASISSNPKTPPQACTTPGNLAYVLYTSGSTGKPKGVQIIHSAVLNFLKSMQREPGLSPNDRLLAITTLSFDIAGLEIFLPLITGAAVVVASRDIATDGVRLVEEIEKSQITVMQATPATWRLLLEAGWGGSPKLKVLCGGEALANDLAEALLPRSAELWNLYGPTETTIWSAAIRVVQGEVIVLGPPIANTQFYIVDDDLQLMPIGVVGELCIGGDGLARGYLNRAELTAEKFIPNPFGNGKIYRTGDLARYRADGKIEFLGRKDHQVKVRGFRIELGEIETVLSSHPAVQQSVVIAREDGPGEKRLAAYFTANVSELPVAELRTLATGRLPEYMIPSAFVQLKAFPLTPNGKIDRRALPKPNSDSSVSSHLRTPPRNQTEQTIADIWKEVLGVNDVGVSDNFFELGGYSLLLAKIHTRLRRAFSTEIPMVELFRYPTIESLAQFFDAPQPKPQRIQPSNSIPTGHHDPEPAITNSIAIVGMAGRFPGAKNIDEFWRNIRDGVESIFQLTDDELLSRGVSAEDISRSNYVKAGTDLHAWDRFDAAFFGFNPKDAEMIDPQQRLFLETSWEALEYAGCAGEGTTKRIGVFAGSGMNTYMLNWLQHVNGTIDPYEAMLGNDKDFLATRVSYKLNLRGPSITVQTACSTSLVAVHVACESLLKGECEAAIAGGVALGTPPRTGYLHQQGMILSPDGHCRAFDENAAGTIGAIGVGVVVLKRLSDALKDGNTIHAVIRGTAINNDGAEKVGYTAPSSVGQAEVVRAAQTAANVDPHTIGYIEAHGTGTPLGDPIEIAGLTDAFRAQTDKKQFCAIGSLKTNVGHLDVAAGVAGLIKTVLALKHQQIPPSLHFTTPNPKIDFANSPFFVNTVLKEWKLHNGTPRRAGVSSFGIGGTNAHVVLEEAPPAVVSESTRRHHLLLLSAKTEKALRSTASDLSQYFTEHPDIDLADAAFTLQTGRKNFNRRRFAVCQTAKDACSSLNAFEQLSGSNEEPRPRKIVFLFTGQGAQYQNMGRELYDTERVFRDTVDKCADLLKPHISKDLRDVLFGGNEPQADPSLLNETAFTQPALFTISYALAQLWMSWGIRPEAMLGHSVGEYVAACLAGVFELPDALRVVAERGRLMQQVPPGSMLAVPLSEKDLQPLLSADLALAATNAPCMSVVSGLGDEIDKLFRQLADRGLTCKKLHTSHAFHSSMVEPILRPFAECLRGIRMATPSVSYVSNVSGAWINPEEPTNPDYWVRHLRQTVRFSQGLQELSTDRDRIFVEVGPGRTLTALAKLHPGIGAKVFPSLPQPNETLSDQKCILGTLGQLWSLGTTVDWTGLYGMEKRRYIPLPTYPFERQRYWIDVPSTGQKPAQPVGERAKFVEWFYTPSWKRSSVDHVLAKKAAGKRETWLIFVDKFNLGQSIARQLRQLGQTVVCVSNGDAFAKHSDDTFSINATASDDYRKLFHELGTLRRVPTRIIHAWSLTGPMRRRISRETIDESLDLSFFSLLNLAQAIRQAIPEQQINLKVLTNELYSVLGDENVSAEKAAILGPCRVIPQENGNLRCTCIDLPSPKSKAVAPSNELLLDELFATTDETTVAHRGQHRWVQTFERKTFAVSPQDPAVIREGGVYLITGGLGGIGFAIAEHLARTARAKLILVGRTKLPPQEEWARWLGVHNETDSICRSIKKVQQLESMGAKVLYVSADVANWDEMKQTVAEADARFGSINGVIHAAGIAGGGLIELKTREAAERVLRPKIHGTFALQSALGGRTLDFFILCSSINAILGGVGQVDYCAANAFLDSFAEQNCSACSINWYAWREVGMAVNTQVPPNLEAERARTLHLGIQSAEGIDALTRIVQHQMRNVVVSPEDFNNLLKQATKQVPEAAPDPDVRSKHARPEVAIDYIEPKTSLEKSLATIWQEVLGIEKIGARDDFFEIGGHSLIGITILSRVKRLTGKDLPLSLLFEVRTIEKMAAYLGDGHANERSRPQTSTRSQIIVPIKRSGTRPPFFCIHGVGGAVIEYSHLARYIEDDQPLYGIQAQGLDGKEPWLSSIEEMADRYLGEMRAVQRKGPYSLGGSSFGGIVAFEIAQRLHAEGERVDLLVFFDSYGRDYPRFLPTSNRFKARMRKAYERFDLHFTNLRLLELRNWPAYIREKAGRIPLRLRRRMEKWKHEIRFLCLPKALRNQFKWTGDSGGDLWHFKLPKAYAVVADLNLQSTLRYQYKPYPGTAVLFRASKQPHGIEPDETNGWGSLIEGDLKIIEVQGYHGAIIREPLVRELAAKLNPLLRERTSGEEMNDLTASATRC